MVASLAAAFVCAAGNIVNDMVDVEIDRINRPSRVLVRGTISMKTARNMAIALNLIAVVLSLVVSLPVAMMALVAIALLLVYNLWLKKVPVVGNIAVALLAGLTFLTGGLAVDPALAFRLPGPLIPFVFAFFMHLVREIVKDVQDIEGDRRAGVVTFPQVIGVSGSLLVALGLLLTLAVLTYVPIFEGWFGRTYEIITVYLVDLPLLALMIFVWGNPNRLMLAIGSAGLKAGMLLGLIALVLA